MFDDRIGNLQKMLARMGPEGRQKYAADHADDPIAVSMALFVNNIAKELKEGKQGEPDMPPPVVQQAIQSMTQPQMPQGMPPQGGPPPQGMPPQGPPQGMPPPQQAPQGVPPPQQAPQGVPPPQGQTQMAADGGYMDSRLPEDMGIGALPERSLSNMADGGIVGYAGGGTPKGDRQPSFDEALDVEGVQDARQRAFLKALYGQESASGANTTTSNQGAVGHMQIKPDTFAGVADPDMDINNPFDNMRAGIRYGTQGYKAAKGDPVLAGAYYYGGPGGLQALAAGKVRTDSKNPQAPDTRQYGEQIAKRMFDLLPMGSAQAATAAPAAPAEDAPSIYSGPGFTPEGLEALGQRLDVIREARAKAKPQSLRDRKTDPDAAQRFEALQNLNKQSQQEYERYAEGLGLNKPAFAAPAAGGKSVGATTLPEVQKVAREAAASDIARQENGDREPYSTGEYQGKSGNPDQDIGPLTPAIKKAAVAEATKAIMASPEPDRLKGFGYEDLLMFGLQLMAGKSQYALQNVGEAGVATLTAKQARAKAAADDRKEAAMARYYEKYGNYLDSEGSRKAAEDKPQMQYQKAIDNAIAKLAATPEYKFAKTPAEKTQMENNARETVKASFLSVYPELADTLGGTPSAGRVIPFNSIQ
jgi:hypothetical protein